MLCVCQALARLANKEGPREYAAISTELSSDGHKWDGVVWAALVLKPEWEQFGSLSPFRLALSDQAVMEQIDR